MKVNTIYDFETYIKLSLKNKYNIDFDIFTIAKCMFYVCDVPSNFTDEIIDFIIKQNVLSKYTVSDSRCFSGHKNLVFSK